jgi:hypothetical protein
MSGRPFVLDLLRDFWPSFALAYYAAGLVLAACLFAWTERDDLGYNTPATLGAGCVFLVFAGAALWPILLGVLAYGNLRTWMRQPRRPARCSWHR